MKYIIFIKIILIYKLNKYNWIFIKNHNSIINHGSQKSKITIGIAQLLNNNLKLGNSTIQYMKNTNSIYIPEDVFFSKSLIDYDIGLVLHIN